MTTENDTLKVFSGNSNLALSEKIASYLKIRLGDITVESFPDGETSVKINENVRGQDVFVIQSTCPPVNQNLMELLTIIDALKRASAKRITAVIPYYGYARQDRKTKPRVPITAKLVADLLATAGANRVLTMDLHAGQIQGFFNIPVDNLTAAPVIVDYFKRKQLENLTVVSPDTGGVDRARNIAEKLSVSIAIIDKRREETNTSMVMNVVGDVEGRNLLIVDDIIDTATTLTQSVEALKARGTGDIYASCTHAVFSGQAIERIEASPLFEVVVTDTIPPKRESYKITVLSVAHILGEAIWRIHKESSITSLFE